MDVSLYARGPNLAPMREVVDMSYGTPATAILPSPRSAVVDAGALTKVSIPAVLGSGSFLRGMRLLSRPRRGAGSYALFG